MSEKKTITYNSVWRAATPQELLDENKKLLERTPKWRILKRLQYKRNIEFWSSNDSQ